MIESLFFFCYYAYLLGDIESTRMYYSILKEEFKINGRKNSLETHQYKRLRKIRDAINTGSIIKHDWIKFVQNPQINSEISIKQKELVYRIHKEGLNQLRLIFKDNVYIYNIEHPCYPYGIVDMVYEGKNTIYPIEVKRGKGDHDLIGQIGKYDLYHQLKLHYKCYKYVQPVTICHSYSFIINELKQMGVLTLLYSISNNKISIKEI